ncbi:TniB family NTP-binding protein [Sphingomonas sp. UYEF23]|uniref:TniB family NTP-binding protein n=1 Tax=Sphingomonas sp. UYEF23 TaxID=1756408 RepID=UPI00339156B3
MSGKKSKSPLGAFSPEELLPSTGYPDARPSPAKSAATRVRDQLVRSIYIHNPNHVNVFKALDLVISLGVKGEFQTGVRNAARSYAGKSSSADEFARIVAARGTYPAGSRPVVRVELEQACTSKRFWTSILNEYGDGFASSRDEEGLRRAAYDAIAKYGTVLLIIDEVQHAGYRSKGSSAATDVIKRFISDAQVGIGLFGNEDALELLQSNNQLSHRLIEPCDIKPLNLSDTGDQARFRTFVRKYGEALVAHKLFGEMASLSDPRVIDCLMAISGGYLGRVSTLLKIAGRRAFMRDATTIEICDLSHASTAWAVEQRLTPKDPFRYGTGGQNG